VFPTVKNSPSTSITQISELQFSYNGTPDFSIPQQVLSLNENLGAQSNAAFVTGITAGIGDVGQTVSFACTNDNNSLFSAQPEISAEGTLIFTTALNAYGDATVSVVGTDNFGRSSAPQTFSIEVAIVPLISPSASSLGDFSTIAGTASGSQSFTVNGRALAGPITLTAPAGFEISTDNSTFSSSLSVNNLGTIQSVYRGAFGNSTTASRNIWATGSGTEYPNKGAFAALKADGSVVTWGAWFYGGDSTAVASSLSSGVTAVYSSSTAFAALKADGSVITWGNAYGGGNSAAVASSLSSNVTAVYSSDGAFAALKADGSVTTWGNPSGGGDSTSVASSLSSGVTAVYSNANAFAALKADGSVVTWGGGGGGDSTAVASSLSSGVTAVYSTLGAFAALKADGSVITWGNAFGGGNSAAVASSLSSDVTAVYSNVNAFAALKTNGSVVTWGFSSWGGNSTAVASSLGSGVTAVYSSDFAFAALKSDGSVVTWGDADYGGNSTGVASNLSSNVREVYSTRSAFAAVKDDGSVVTWGGADGGGSSTAVASSLGSGSRVTVYSTRSAFAALKADGSIVTWGNSNEGGDSTAVASSLSSGVIAVYSTELAFAALKADGSVVTWGDANGGSGAPANIAGPATIYTRLSSTAPVGSVSGNITLTSSGAQTQTVALSGTVTDGPTYTHQELWRFANFGSYTSDGSAADSADPDGDGLSNLMEYALGTGPNSSGVMPAVLALNGANLEYTYTRSTAAKDNGVTYQIEWSETLEAGSWSTETVTQQITSTQGALETVKASIPKGTTGKRFLRLKVQAVSSN
jgi:hypothetical protein